MLSSVKCVGKEQKIDMMFVLDGSKSIQKNQFKLVQDWVVRVANKFNIKNSNATQVGVVQYSYYDAFGRDEAAKWKWIETEIPLSTQNPPKNFKVGSVGQ